MVKNDVRSRTVTFMAVQSLILGVIMLAFVVLTSILFVKNATRWQLKNIEEDLIMFSRQASRSGEVPKRGDLGPYVFFILTPDGKYVLPHMSRTDESERLWQEYEHKLVYEMQKRRDGWIFYPEDRSFGFGRGQNVIRYIYLEPQGWIMAVEGYVSSGWSILQGFLTPKLFVGLFIIVVLAFGFMLVSAFWHFRKVMKAILKLQENNFIAAPSKPLPEALFVKREDSPFNSGVIQNTQQRVLPKSRPERVERTAAPEPEEELLAAPEAPGRREATATRPGPRKETPSFAPRQLEDLGDVTIDTTDIRSPLLRKAIEELREEKK